MPRLGGLHQIQLVSVEQLQRNSSQDSWVVGGGGGGLQMWLEGEEQNTRKITGFTKIDRKMEERICMSTYFATFCLQSTKKIKIFHKLL